MSDKKKFQIDNPQNDFAEKKVYWHGALRLALSFMLSGLIFDILLTQSFSFTIAGSWIYILSAMLPLLFSMFVCCYYARKYSLQFFFSLPLITVTLFLLMFWVVLGTIILQNLRPAEYEKAYGAFAKAILFLHLNDMFANHTLSALVLLINISLLSYLSQVKFSHRNIGLIILHAAIILVSVGGLVGVISKEKGNINIHIGETTDHIYDYNPQSVTLTPKKIPFSVKLENFRVEEYPLEWRLTLLDRSKNLYEIYDPAKAKLIQAGDSQFHIQAYHKNAYLRREVAKDKSASSSSCYRFLVYRNKKEQEGSWLSTQQDNKFHLFDIPTAQARLFLFASLKDMKEKFLSGKHWLEYKHRRYLLKMQETADLGTQLSVRPLKFIPDFAFNIRKKDIEQKSWLPVNPALKVALYPVESARRTDRDTKTPGLSDDGKMKEQWLYTRFQENNPLRYSYESGYKFSEKNYFYLVDRQSFFKINEKGQLLPIGREVKSAGMTLKPSEILRDCSLKEALVQGGKDIKPAIPVLEVSYGPAEDSQHKKFMTYLEGYNRYQLSPDQEIFLQPHQGEPKNYHSVLSIQEAGKEKLRRKVKVNDPLVYQGYWIYQANYKKEDPRFSGLLVVKDRGLYLVYAGLILLALGTLYHFIYKHGLSPHVRIVRK